MDSEEQQRRARKVLNVQELHIDDDKLFENNADTSFQLIHFLLRFEEKTNLKPKVMA